MRVVIVGAGIMGCTTALALASRGASVVLLERAVPGAEASSAAAGILGAQAESHEPGPLFERMLRARDAYGEVARRLASASGLDVGYRATGVLKLAYDAHEEGELEKVTTWQRAAGARAFLLSQNELRAVEPHASPAAICAAHFPDDAQVEPTLLLRALIESIRKSTVEVRSGTTVGGFIVEDGACRGVHLGDERLLADAVVLAAGSWSSLVPGAPTAARLVKPIRGQMVELEERPASLRTVLFGGGTYVVPRGDGRVVCGSTMEDVGFEKAVTAEGLKNVLGGSMQNAPILAKAAFTRTWANFRPFSPGPPLVGASDVPNLFLATGHYRNGILLAFDTAEAVSMAVLPNLARQPE